MLLLSVMVKVGSESWRKPSDLMVGRIIASKLSKDSNWDSKEIGWR